MQQSVAVAHSACNNALSAERKDGHAPVWLHPPQPPSTALEPGWRRGPGPHPREPQKTRQRREH